MSWHFKQNYEDPTLVVSKFQVRVEPDIVMDKGIFSFEFVQVF